MADEYRKIDIYERPPAAYRYGELPAESAMLEELLKGVDFQHLFESYYNLIHIPVAIIDLNANVLFSSRWQRICAMYHRVNPKTLAGCLDSDKNLAQHLNAGESYTMYACRNGLTDCASPIIVEGKHIANLFIGQFLTKQPDENWFRERALEFGFDADDYLAALREVPIVDAARIPLILDLLQGMTTLVTNLAIERKRALEAQARQSVILNTIPQSVFWKDINGRYLGCNSAFAKAAGMASPEDIIGKTDFDLPWPRKEAEAYRADDAAVISANQPRMHIVEPVQRADGSRIVVDTSKVPLVDAPGHAPTGVLGIYEDVTAQTLVAEALHESEARFRTLSENSLAGIYIVQEGRLTYVNPALARIFGYQVGELIGADPLLVIHPDDRVLVTENMRRRLSGEQVSMHYEFRGLRKDGSASYIEVLGTRVELQGDPAIIGNIIDITERKRAEDELRKSEAYRRAIFESARDAIIVMRNDVFIDCNAVALTLYGADRESLIGHAPYEFSPPTQPDGRSSKDSALEKIEAALKGVPQFFEWKHQKLDGTLFDAEVSLGRVEVGDGVLIQALVRDVSFRKRTDEALRKSEERFQLSMEATSDGLWDWNAVTNEVYYSPACYHMLGYEVGDFPGTLQAWQDLLHPDDIVHTMQVNMDCVEGRRETFAVEYRLKAKNGEWRWILGRGKSIVRDAQGRSLRLVGTNTDVTERRRAEEKLHESEEQYRMLITAMAEGVTLQDENSAIIAFNKSAEQILGLTAEQLSGRTSFDPRWYPIHEDGSPFPGDTHPVVKTLKTGMPQANVIMGIHKPDGELTWISVSTQPIFKEGVAKPYRVVATMHDITERRRAEERLHESETRFRSAFMTGAIAYVIVEEATGKLIEVNDCFLKLYGYNREEVIGHTSLELGMWVIPEARAELLAQLQAHDRVENFEVLAARKGGERFWVLYSVNRLTVQGAQLLLGAINDITARKVAEQRIEDYVKQLEGTLESTLQAVSSMVEMRDPYTAGHELRVGQIAAEIAREMGWSEEKQKRLQLIGLVHDIGKIAVPAEILTKPTRLTAIEFELVKTHAEKGYEILKDVRSEMPVAEIIRQHHERMDGSGYPHGLKGNQILMEARILAVADVLESMASHRPYRPALGIDAAIKEISGGRGTKFDETVVDTLLRMIREKDYKLPE